LLKFDTNKFASPNFVFNLFVTSIAYPVPHFGPNRNTAICFMFDWSHSENQLTTGDKTEGLFVEGGIRGGLVGDGGFRGGMIGEGWCEGVFLCLSLT
jgi:hypothetical protein